MTLTKIVNLWTPFTASQSLHRQWRIVAQTIYVPGDSRRAAYVPCDSRSTTYLPGDSKSTVICG